MQQQEIVAGDSLNFLTAGGDYPASAGWALQLLLNPRTGTTIITVNATAEGDDFRFAIAAGTTASWASGAYTWFERVSKAGEVYTLDQGQVTIKPNPAALSAGYDGRTLAEKALEDAQSAYATFTATRGATRRYKIGEREMEFHGTADIVQQINYWSLQVKWERRNKALSEGRPDPSKAYVRLNRG